MCVCESIGTSSMVRLIHRAVVSVRMLPTLDLKAARGGSGAGPRCAAHAQLLKLQKAVGFPTILQKQNVHKLTVKEDTEALATADMKEIELEGLLLQSAR